MQKNGPRCAWRQKPLYCAIRILFITTCITDRLFVAFSLLHPVVNLTHWCCIKLSHSPFCQVIKLLPFSLFFLPRPSQTLLQAIAQAPSELSCKRPFPGTAILAPLPASLPVSHSTAAATPRAAGCSPLEEQLESHWSLLPGLMWASFVVCIIGDCAVNLCF